jgi:hypothetical protein
LLVAFTLEGVLPGMRRPRAPVPLVRYDRIRGPRARAHLFALARRLLGVEPTPVVSSFVDARGANTRTSGGSTGALNVFFQ